MPEIDLSDLVLDPDIAGQSFTVIRRQEIVNNFGFSQVTTKTISVLGAVQPTGDNSLVRDEAYDAQAKTLRVVTSFRLRGVSASSGGAMYKPDQILWNGDTYEVKTVDDYSQFGGGLIEAECVQIVYDGTPPSELPPSGVIGMLDFSQAANSAYAALTGAGV